MSGMTDEWLTTQEACQLTKYHPVYLRDLIRKKKIAAVKKGNAWWVNRKALLTYVREAGKSEDKRRGPKG